VPEIHQRFDPQFRERAVRIVRETGKPIAQVGRDLGIKEGTLGVTGSPRDRVERGERDGVSGDERTKLVALRREVAELWMERDVPKR